MAETLVPIDQPYGERQKFVEGAKTAGLPLDSPAVPATGPSPFPPSGAGGGTPRLGFDPLRELQPMQAESEFVQPSYRQRLEESLRTSPNPLMREAARRILGEQ